MRFNVPKTWNLLGKGSFNKAYLSDDGQEVLKIQKSNALIAEADTPERSVRLWNLINPNVQPPARLETDAALGAGWVCPYIEGVQASDEDMVSALIDIFNRTGRIVVDAPAPDNFIKRSDGLVVCIDVGLAVRLERCAEEQNSQFLQTSQTSLTTWGIIKERFDTAFFKTWDTTYTQTINTIKALLFIKDARPDIYDASFLKNDPNLISQLAKAYDNTGEPLTEDILASAEQKPQDKVSDLKRRLTEDKENAASNEEKRPSHSPLGHQ